MLNKIKFLPLILVFVSIAFNDTTINQQNEKNIFSDNYISYQALLDANEIYDKKYSDLKDMHDRFLSYLNIIITVLAGMTGFLVLYNFISVKNTKKEMKKHNKEIQSIRATTFSSIAGGYFVSARAFFDIAKNVFNEGSEEYAKKIMRHHFFNLKAYFNFISRNNLDLDHKDINNIKLLTEHCNSLGRDLENPEKGSDKFIDFYGKIFRNDKEEFFKYSEENSFLYSLSNFREHCKKFRDKTYLAEIKKVFEELYKVFGKENIETAIKTVAAKESENSNRQRKINRKNHYELSK